LSPQRTDRPRGTALHPFLAYGDRPDEPTAAVFDLDPGRPADVVDCARVALRLRTALDGLGLASFPKTSGVVGLHVYVPLNTPHGYSETKAFARTLAAFLAHEEPELIVDRQAKRLREGKVLVDSLQNDPTRSTVAAYSLRGTAWPTVSMPVSWKEIEETAATGRSELLTFTPERALGRLEAESDVFAPVLHLEQALPH
jgi:bifunctional non-homologous end joining protein LigD